MFGEGFLSINHQRNDLLGSDLRKLNRWRWEYWALLLRSKGESTTWVEMQPVCHWAVYITAGREHAEEYGSTTLPGRFSKTVGKRKHEVTPLTLSRLFALWATPPPPSQVALVVKNPLPNARSLRDAGLIPGLGRSPGGGNGNLLQDSCLENPMDWGAWWL